MQHQKAVELPRLRVIDKGKRRTRCINYRHVVKGLRRKPRAFLYCTWQQDLLPDQWQDRWQQLKAQFELDNAAVLIVEALYIAATQDKEQSAAQCLQTLFPSDEIGSGFVTGRFLGTLAALTDPPWGDGMEA